MARKAEATEPQFVLKHRITGAGIMLAFGVILLPWLLGPPDDPHRVASNQKSLLAQEGVIASELSSDSVQSPSLKETTLSDESLKQLLIESIEQESIEQEEQVYISKITPLDSGGVQPLDESQSQVVKDVEEKNRAIDTKASQSEAQKKPASDTKPEPKEAQESIASVSDETDQKQPVVVQAEVDKVVEVGWMVSVGVFSQQKNVEGLLKSLQNKGFVPHTSIFETNKGAATRVWLGPYELRVDAAKAKTKLKEKTGELGLIKAYP